MTPTRSFFTFVFLFLRGPVHHHHDRWRAFGFFEGSLDQEALTIGRDVVGRNAERRAGDACLEQLAWTRDLERGRASLDLDRHQLAVLAEIEKLFAVVAPSRAAAAIDRYLSLPGGRGKTLHVDLVSRGFVRLICDPVAVRRELAVHLVELGLEYRNRLAVTFHREHPQ